MLNSSSPSPRRLYLDNAATTFPKPPAVLDAMTRYATQLGASAGRGAYEEAIQTGDLIKTCRIALNNLLNGENPDNFVFTLNCSQALNFAIKGLVLHARENSKSKPHCISTHIDHNSILRPLNALADRNWIEQTRIPVDPSAGLIDLDDIRKSIRPSTTLIALTHASNVTGTLQPLREIGLIAQT